MLGGLSALFGWIGGLFSIHTLLEVVTSFNAGNRHWLMQGLGSKRYQPESSLWGVFQTVF